MAVRPGDEPSSVMAVARRMTSTHLKVFMARNCSIARGKVSKFCAGTSHARGRSHPGPLRSVPTHSNRPAGYSIPGSVQNLSPRAESACSLWHRARGKERGAPELAAEQGHAEDGEDGGDSEGEEHDHGDGAPRGDQRVHHQPHSLVPFDEAQRAQRAAETQDAGLHVRVNSGSESLRHRQLS
eukprot:3419765-Rhodomonas_salina.3